MELGRPLGPLGGLLAFPIIVLAMVAFPSDVAHSLWRYLSNHVKGDCSIDLDVVRTALPP